jgi:hypothetical protein
MMPLIKTNLFNPQGGPLNHAGCPGITLLLPKAHLVSSFYRLDAVDSLLAYLEEQIGPFFIEYELDFSALFIRKETATYASSINFKALPPCFSLG